MQNNVLTDKHTACGLSLEEIDDHILFLKAGARVVKAFMQSAVNPVEILKAADEYLLEIDAQ